MNVGGCFTCCTVSRNVRTAVDPTFDWNVSVKSATPNLPGATAIRSCLEVPVPDSDVEPMNAPKPVTEERTVHADGGSSGSSTTNGTDTSCADEGLSSIQRSAIGEMAGGRWTSRIVRQTAAVLHAPIGSGTLSTTGPGPNVPGFGVCSNVPSPPITATPFDPGEASRNTNDPVPSASPGSLTWSWAINGDLAITA